MKMPQSLKSNGFSLIEILIAIVLGLLLLSGVLAIFVGNKQTFRIQDGSARIQENGRYAQFILSKEIRMAGFQGCPKLNIVIPTNRISSPQESELFTNNKIIQGYDAANNLPNWISSNIATGTSIPANSHIIVVKKASALAANLTSGMTALDDPLAIAGNILSINVGDPVIVSDCEAADIFKAGAGSTSTGTVTHPTTNNINAQLTKLYQTDARVYALQSFAFYIKNTGRTNSAGQPVFALYRQDIHGNEEELTEGIQDMKISYGVDTNNDNSVNSYQSASQVTAANNWDKVISVDIALLVNSVEGVNPKPQQYTFAGATHIPVDRLSHKEWTAFIKLRNRLPN